MNTIPVTLLFSDGATRKLDLHQGDNIVRAAAQAGLSLLTDCANGQCGTCTASLVSGAVEMDEYDPAVLPDEDRKCGAILACVSRATAPCVVELPYDISEATAEEAPPIEGRITCIEQVADETMRLEVEIGEELDFHPGQYVRIRPAGGSDWRSYSMANASGRKNLVFYVRIVSGGVFSTWLSGQAQLGDTVELSDPRGAFFLREEERPCLFVAGGTGLAPFLSMLEKMAAGTGKPAQPTTLLLGVRSGSHLFALEQLERLRRQLPSLDVRLAAEQDPGDGCLQGYATDIIKTLELDPATRVYLCGPPPMVDAARAAVAACGLPREGVLCERFA
jgi:3-phenylpropionate/trans-cinnamate dioxygenase ferredoxin reductase subunit